MMLRTLRTRIALAPLVLSGFVLTCRAVVADESCVTGKCDAAMLKGQSVHAVAESCSTCHESTGAPHPQKGQKTFQLTQDLGSLGHRQRGFGGRDAASAPAKTTGKEKP